MEGETRKLLELEKLRSEVVSNWLSVGWSADEIIYILKEVEGKRRNRPDA